MRVTNKTRKLLADVKKMCNARSCDRCPLWDDALECRLRNPYLWRIDDWNEYKEEGNVYHQEGPAAQD